jgi:Uncharacterised ACR, YggU family COG1872
MATLRFHIVPNAGQNKVIGEHGGAIKIKLRAPAVEGKANVALRTKSRGKLIRIGGLNDEERAVAWLR